MVKEGVYKFRNVFLILASILFMFAFISEVSAVAWSVTIATQNFDTNSTSGLIRYRPLQQTWIKNTNGIPNAIAFPSNYAWATNYTYSLWLNLSVNQTGGSYAPYVILLTNFACGGLLYFNETTGFLVASGTGINNSDTLNDSRWHNIVITKNSTAKYMWIDGNLISSGAPSDCTLWTMMRGATGSNGFTGSMDDFRAYNTSLTQAQILEINSSINRERNDSQRYNSLDFELPFDETSEKKSWDVFGLKNGTRTSYDGANNGVNLTTLGYNVGIIIENISKAFSFWQNYTLINASINESYTFNFLNNDTLYLLQDFNVTDGKYRTNSPLNFSFSNYTLKNLTSILLDNITAAVTIYLNTSSCNVQNVSYVSHTGAFSQVFNSSQLNCTNNWTMVNVSGIEPATGSNQFFITYGSPDSTPPNVTINTPSNISYSTNSLVFNVTVVDNIGIDTCLYSLNNGVENYSMTNLTTSPSDWTATNTSMQTGGITVTFYCNDTSNNLNSTETKSFYIDLAKPKIIITTPSNYTNTSNTNLDINYTASDNSALSKCWWTNDSSVHNYSLTDCTTNITDDIWNEGITTLTIFSNDTANNVNSSSVTFTIDTTKPIPNIIYPLNTSYNTNVNSINYSVTETNCHKAWYSTDNGVTNSSTVDCRTNFTSVTSTENSNTWTIYINDSSGNQNQTSVTFIKDTINPLVSITTPSNNSNSSNTNLDVNYTASDTTLAYCWYSNDSMALNTTLAGCANITTVTWSEGQHNVTVWANDSAGNLNSSFVRFTIDTITPLISYGTGTENNNTNISRNWIYVNVSVTETNENTIIFTLFNSTGLVNKTSFTDRRRTINWTGLPNEFYYYNVSINDSANNKNVTTLRKITLDTASPIINLITPINAAEDTDGTTTFTYNVSDIHLLVLNCSIYLNNILKQTDGSMTENDSQTFTISEMPESDSLQWSINCTDSLNQIRNSGIRLLDTQLGAGSPTSGGGSGSSSINIGNNIGITNISSLVCKRTYDSAKLDTYTGINNIISIIGAETGETLSWTTVRAYIDNWEDICADKINRTLKEDILCPKIFYFITDKGYDYDLIELNDLRVSLYPDLSMSKKLLNSYIDNYYEMCYLTGLSEKLPQKSLTSVPISSSIGIDLPKCQLLTGNYIFDISFPLPKIEIGEEFNCNRIDSLRVWIKMVSDDKGKYYMIGLKLWWLGLLSIMFLLFMIFRSNKDMNKIVKSYTKNA